MPLYEYRCLSCGHQFEKIQSFSAPEEKECPVCKGKVERLISAPAIQFKGAGWYVTDYAGKGGSKNAAKSADASGDGKASPSSPENKSAASSNSGSSTPGTTSSTSKSE